MEKQCPKPKRKRDATLFRDKVLLVEAKHNDLLRNSSNLRKQETIHDGRVIVQPIQAKAFLMANLSSYGLDVLFEVPHSENTHNDMLNQSVQEMLYSQQTYLVNYPENEITNSGKHFVPQQELLDEQAFRLQTLHPSTNQPASSPVKIEAPQELPKCFEIQKKQFLIENDPFGSNHFSRYCEYCCDSSMDINTSMNVNSSVAMNDSVNYAKLCNKCLDLEAELIKQHNIIGKDEYNRLLKSFSKLKQHSISLELAEKVLVITALKNDLRKFKGKYIVDNDAQVSNATTIAPGMYMLDPLTLAPKNNNNRETHIYYLKHTMKQAAILREIVEQAKSLNPLDSASYSACKYVKLIQELLGYARDTCPDIHKPRVIQSTKSSRSKSTNDRKNDRILQISRSTKKKNKVEDHSRIVKSSLNKSNCVDEPSRNANVQHSKLNTNSKIMCVKCNSSMFDARHELCFLKFVSDMNELSCVHDTFHVSNLKKCLAEPYVQVPLDKIEINENLHFVEEPIEIVERDVKKLKRRRISLVKVRWNSQQGAEYTWER
nr:reverse transcriptase domain-containing protein [Tanacetum cinerariifolium]